MQDQIIGKKFGKLTPIKKIVGSDKNKYLCKCECGNIKEIPKYNITSGNTKSCGCLRKIENIIGKKFGKLTVIKEYGKDKNNKTMYLCKCDCGNETIIRRDSIISQRTKSCGCMKRKDIIGKKYNRLTVVEYYGMISGIYYYKCDCECGTKGVIINRNSLSSGATKSCGCLKRKDIRIEYYKNNF